MPMRLATGMELFEARLTSFDGSGHLAFIDYEKVPMRGIDRSGVAE